MFEQTNTEDLRDAKNVVFEVGQLVSEGEPRDAIYYGRVIGFTSTDLDHYPTIAVRWENSGVEEHTGHQTHMDSPSFVEDVFVV